MHPAGLALRPYAPVSRSNEETASSPEISRTRSDSIVTVTSVQTEPPAVVLHPLRCTPRIACWLSLATALVTYPFAIEPTYHRTEDIDTQSYLALSAVVSVFASAAALFRAAAAIRADRDRLEPHE
jgi:hypothetical protein